MQDIIYVLDMLAMPLQWFMHLPQWVAYLALGVVLTYTLGIAGFVLARLGIKPLWVLLLLVPWANVVGLWWLACQKHKRMP